MLLGGESWVARMDDPLDTHPAGRVSSPAARPDPLA